MCAAIGESASELYRLTGELDICDQDNSGCSQILRRVNILGTATFDVVVKTRSGKTFIAVAKAGANAYVGCRVSHVSLPVEVVNSANYAAKAQYFFY